ncbi:translation initiation factor IF-2-like [Panicum virgatum]|uniref:translation initiation factor IF-2-like n=1 Tax=Panicum virgatum TaxID=38727 RepID=UPI0019D56F79|nr:translation initiation factor IF-2-like [Panicum virgatum]
MDPMERDDKWVPTPASSLVPLPSAVGRRSGRGDEAPPDGGGEGVGARTPTGGRGEAAGRSRSGVKAQPARGGAAGRGVEARRREVERPWGRGAAGRSRSGGSRRSRREAERPAAGLRRAVGRWSGHGDEAPSSGAERWEDGKDDNDRTGWEAGVAAEERGAQAGGERGDKWAPYVIEGMSSDVD